VVEHRGNAVESESVKAELLHPVSYVRQQESGHFQFAVVEASAVPESVRSPGIVVEEAVVAAVEFVNSVQDVY